MHYLSFFFLSFWHGLCSFICLKPFRPKRYRDLFAWMRIEGQRGIYESVVLGIFFVLDLYDGLVKKIQIVVTNYYFVL